MTKEIDQSISKHSGAQTVGVSTHAPPPLACNAATDAMHKSLKESAIDPATILPGCGREYTGGGSAGAVQDEIRVQ